MGLLQRINNFLVDNFGNGISDDDSDGVVVTAVAKPYIVIRGEKEVKQYNFSLDFAEAENKVTFYQFNFDVKKALDVATSVTLNNVTIDDKTYNALPAWYDASSFALYYPINNGYFTLSADANGVYNSLVP